MGQAAFLDTGGLPFRSIAGALVGRGAIISEAEENSRGTVPDVLEDIVEQDGLASVEKGEVPVNVLSRISSIGSDALGLSFMWTCYLAWRDEETKGNGMKNPEESGKKDAQFGRTSSSSIVDVLGTIIR